MNKLIQVAALAVAIAVVIGCSKSDAPPFANVSGTVTYNGKPIEKGQITFTTEGRPPTMADIVDGKFAGQAMVGSNRVAISAFRKSAKAREIPASAMAQAKAYQAMGKGGSSSEPIDLGSEDYIPPEWGRDSKQVRVVEAGGANKFDFEIKGK
jgi:hypothetical protein